MSLFPPLGGIATPPAVAEMMAKGSDWLNQEKNRRRTRGGRANQVALFKPAIDYAVLLAKHAPNSDVIRRHLREFLSMRALTSEFMSENTTDLHRQVREELRRIGSVLRELPPADLELDLSFKTRL